MKYLLIAMIMVGLVFSCTEIFDYDISDEKVNLLTPPNGYETDIASFTFNWGAVEFADQYVLQIASPGFEWMEYLILDTTITKNSFMYTLSPGSFQWRVKALNNSYETGFSTYSFEIDSSNDLSGETLQLLLPFNHDTTNKVQMNFKWLTLYNATLYNLELYYESNLILVESTTEDHISLSMDVGEGDYTWKVQAVNQVSETNFSERHLYLDTTSPLQPNLSSPANNSYWPDSTTHFSWVRNTDNGSRLFDSLFVYSDSLLLVNLIAARMDQTHFADSMGPGEFFWRVRTYDIAGNSSEISDTWKFTINP